MSCSKYEKLITRSLDGRLDPDREKRLRLHLEACPACRRAAAEYAALRTTLAAQRLEEAPPASFRAALARRLEAEREAAPLVFYEKLCFRAIPVFLALAVLAASIFILAPKSGETPSSEMLLLSSENPFTETSRILDEQKPENRNMMLIFASLEEPSAARRPLP
jgi:anti-sigma factor RsiW